MRKQAMISKWGNSLAVRIPLVLAKQAKLAEGDAVELQVDRAGGLAVLRSKKTYDLDELLSRMTPKNRHGAMDWGPPVGKEIW